VTAMAAAGLAAIHCRNRSAAIRRLSRFGPAAVRTGVSANRNRVLVPAPAFGLRRTGNPHAALSHPPSETREGDGVCYGRLDVAVDARADRARGGPGASVHSRCAAAEAPICTSPLSRCARAREGARRPRQVLVADELIRNGLRTWEGRAWESVGRASSTHGGAISGTTTLEAAKTRGPWRSAGNAGLIGSEHPQRRRHRDYPCRRDSRGARAERAGYRRATSQRAHRICLGASVLSVWAGTDRQLRSALENPHSRRRAIGQEPPCGRVGSEIRALNHANRDRYCRR